MESLLLEFKRQNSGVVELIILQFNKDPLCREYIGIPQIAQNLYIGLVRWLRLSSNTEICIKVLSNLLYHKDTHLNLTNDVDCSL